MYRCDGGPLLRDEGGCLTQGNYGQRRANIAWASGVVVQLFSTAELALGISTSLSMPTRKQLCYGTTTGFSALPLIALDLLLLLPQQAMSMPREPVPETRLGFWQRMHGYIHNSMPVKTISGYQKLKALPPAPWPLQRFIDQVLLPAWLGSNPTIQTLISKLPFVDGARCSDLSCPHVQMA